MDQSNLELVGNALVPVCDVSGVCEDAISTTSSKKKRAKSSDADSCVSFKSIESVGSHKMFKDQIENQVGIMEGELISRIDQQEQFKTAANQLVGEVKESIQILNKNQPAQQSIVSEQKTKLRN